MEAFGVVGKQQIYKGMEEYCCALADTLTPVWEERTPHIFPAGFFEDICRRIDEQKN